MSLPLLESQRTMLVNLGARLITEVGTGRDLDAFRQRPAGRGLQQFFTFPLKLDQDLAIHGMLRGTGVLRRILARFQSLSPTPLSTRSSLVEIRLFSYT